MELSFEPSCGRWKELLAGEPAGEWRGVTMAQWRRRTRAELGLAVDRPVIATGHQTLLWHPGILVKYLAVQAMVGDGATLAPANLVVDQHTGTFGRFDVPVRRPDGGLGVETVTLTGARKDVPMGQHPAFPPPAPPRLAAALPSVEEGMRKIVSAVGRHAGEPNAALQMAAALRDLMTPWVAPWPDVCASGLMRTGLADGLLREMADDPRRCAIAYNAAVAAVPSGGIGPLAVTADWVELPLWRLGPDGRRHHAGDEDVRRWIEAGPERPELLPRALLLTALVRTGMCDLFIHGTGGAAYDRAMERWLDGWLGLRPAPIAVATATLRLPLRRDAGEHLSPAEAKAKVRRILHDPEHAGAAPGPRKQALLAEIDAAPRRSRARLDAFRRMHAELESWRGEHREALDSARRRLEAARRRALEAPIADRRDWPFPLYPPKMIDELAAMVRRELR